MFVSLAALYSREGSLTASRCDLWLHESDPAYEIAPRSLQMDSKADGQYVFLSLVVKW